MIKNYSEQESVDNFGAIQYDREQKYLNQKDLEQAQENIGVKNIIDTVQSNSASWGQGGGGIDNSNTFTIISGVTTNKEVSENSGKGLFFKVDNCIYPQVSYTNQYDGYGLYRFEGLNNWGSFRVYEVRIVPSATSATKHTYSAGDTFATTGSTVNVANTAYTAYYDTNGRPLVAFPETGTLDPTATYSLKWNGNSSYYWSKDGSSPTPTGTSIYPIIHYYAANQNSSGATISGSNVNISVRCDYGECDVQTGTQPWETVNLTAGQTTSFTLNGEFATPRATNGNISDCSYSADNDFIAIFGSDNTYYDGGRVMIREIGKYNTINIEGNQVTGAVALLDNLNNVISSFSIEESSTFNNTYTIPDSIQGRTVACVSPGAFNYLDWYSWTATKV